MQVAPNLSGHAFLTSTSEREAAQESGRLRGSFFTHALVTGLRGQQTATAISGLRCKKPIVLHSMKRLSRTEATLGGPQHATYDIQLVGARRFGADGSARWFGPSVHPRRNPGPRDCARQSFAGCRSQQNQWTDQPRAVASAWAVSGLRCLNRSAFVADRYRCHRKVWSWRRASCAMFRLKWPPRAGPVWKPSKQAKPRRQSDADPSLSGVTGKMGHRSAVVP